MSHARCACPKDGPRRGRPNSLACVRLLLTWAVYGAIARAPAGGLKATHDRADELTQRKPRTLSRNPVHCSRCLGRPPARPASPPVIRATFCARTARRELCNAGVSTTLGDVCDADATKLPTPRNANATDRVWGAPNADATRRSLTPLDTDATQRLPGRTEPGRRPALRKRNSRPGGSITRSRAATQLKHNRCVSSTSLGLCSDT